MALGASMCEKELGSEREKELGGERRARKQARDQTLILMRKQEMRQTLQLQACSLVWVGALTVFGFTCGHLIFYLQQVC